MTAFTVAEKRSSGACSNGCHGRAGRREGNQYAHLAGYPLGFLCPPCVKAMHQAWHDALNNWEQAEVTELTLCACNCRTPVKPGHTYAEGHNPKSWTSHATRAAA